MFFTILTFTPYLLVSFKLIESYPTPNLDKNFNLGVYFKIDSLIVSEPIKQASMF